MYFCKKNEKGNFVLKAESYSETLKKDLPTELVLDSSFNVLLARFVDESGSFRENGIACIEGAEIYVSFRGDITVLTPKTELASAIGGFLDGSGRKDLFLSEEAIDILKTKIRDDRECIEIRNRVEKNDEPEESFDQGSIAAYLEMGSGALCGFLKRSAGSIRSRASLMAILAGLTLPSNVMAQDTKSIGKAKVEQALSEPAAMSGQQKLVKGINKYEQENALRQAVDAISGKLGAIGWNNGKDFSDSLNAYSGKKTKNNP